MKKSEDFLNCWDSENAQKYISKFPLHYIYNYNFIESKNKHVKKVDLVSPNADVTV